MGNKKRKQRIKRIRKNGNIPFIPKAENHHATVSTKVELSEDELNAIREKRVKRMQSDVRTVLGLPSNTIKRKKNATKLNGKQNRKLIRSERSERRKERAQNWANLPFNESEL